MKKIVLISFLCVLLSGCLSERKYHMAENDAMQTDSADGITVTCEFLDEGVMREKYGNTDNPFISPDMTVTPWYIFVFEVTIKNETDKIVKYDAREVNFYFGEKSSRPMSERDMNDKIKEYDNGGSKLKQQRIARRTMYRNTERIMAGDNFKKYIVFMNNFRQRGEAELEIPLFTQDGSIAGEFSFEYSFLKKKKGDDFVK